MDKKQTLKEAAYEVFSKKGYKATSISEIAKQAKVAVGTFYNFYESKEKIFLDVYIAENNRIRQFMINNIDWEGDVVKLTEQLFGQSRSLISTNKILSKIQEILKIYTLFNYIDMNVTEKDIPNVSETTERLAIYFVKGLFKG